MDKTKPTCIRVKELMLLQIKLFQEYEFKNHQKKLMAEDSRTITLGEAKQKYIGSMDQSIYCAGLKAAYCGTYCTENCPIKYDKKTQTEQEEKISEILLKKINGDNLHSCSNLDEIVREEFDPLIEEIKKHKYYLSEKMKKNVGWDFAANDFIEYLLPKWVEGFEAVYCNLVCSKSEKCQDRFEKI